jgi:1,4-dihydroxy-6-naphthoate synthase
MNFTLGFSPCPNDTFIFDALVNNKIDTGDLSFDVILEDVETLNEWALNGRLDITKLSFPALFQATETYALLHSGSALGKGVGPLLVSYGDAPKDAIENHPVALPGQHTTANLLFSFAYPGAIDKKFMIFSEIEDAVVNGKTDLGVIIHENRFTYQEKGLKKVADLGEYWETRMNAPIPLGGIAIKRTLGRQINRQVDVLIRKSLDYAFKNYPSIPEYVRQHSQAMSEEVMKQHIDLYVNNYSLDLGEEGRKAIETLRGVFEKNNGHPVQQAELFI